MTISSYSELKTAIATYMHRADLTGRDDEAIDNFEAKINRKIRTAGLETTATGNMVSGTATISFPTGYAEIRSFTYVPVTGSVRKLEYITPEQADALEYTANGPPQWFTLVGNAIRLYPTPDSTYAYTIRIYRTIVPLDGSNTSNWLLASHPDIYLAGCQAEMAMFAEDYDKFRILDGFVNQWMQDLIRSDRRANNPTPVAQFDAELRAFPSSRNIETDGE
jgi:hypothetical protein